MNDLEGFIYTCSDCLNNDNNKKEKVKINYFYQQHVIKFLTCNLFFPN